MRKLRYVVADVFTDRPLTGNQLAVFTNASELDAETMQALTREMAFSESVFLLPPTEGGHARIRIFTPALELPFAGHPTLGSAFVIGTTVQLGELRLETGRGVIPVRLEREGARVVFGWMTQPVPSVSAFPQEKQLLDALGLKRSWLPVELYDNGPTHTQVVIESTEELRSLRPNQQMLAELDVTTVSVTVATATRGPIDSPEPRGTASKELHAKSSRGEPEVESRVFCPQAGVLEDAATGSAAGPLAMHLVRHGVLESGDELRISQGSELKRPSRLHARVFQDEAAAIERVEVGGSAVIVARGEFTI